MELVRRIFWRDSASKPRGAPLLPPESVPPELAAARATADEAAANLREALAENEELKDLVALGQSEEATTQQHLVQLETELLELESIAETAQTNHQEELQCRSEKNASESRRSSEAHSSELAALRLQVAAGAASRDDFCKCEASTERVRVEANRARRALDESETVHAEASAAVERSHDHCLKGEAEVRSLKEELKEAQEEAQRRDASYWEDAPFLMASADVVNGYEAELAENNRIASEIQEALEQERILHEDALREEREAFVFAGNVAPNQDPILPVTPSLPCESIASPRPQAPVQAALASLHAENERLRQKVTDLRGDLDAAAHARAAPQSHANPSHSFDAAVAGTGARVVEQMKQALREDVGLLRNLHQVKQELDRERRAERRTHAALERRLAALARASRSPAPAGAGVSGRSPAMVQLKL